MILFHMRLSHMDSCTCFSPIHMLDLSGTHHRRDIQHGSIRLEYQLDFLDDLMGSDIQRCDRELSKLRDYHRF